MPLGSNRVMPKTYIYSKGESKLFLLQVLSLAFHGGGGWMILSKSLFLIVCIVIFHVSHIHLEKDLAHNKCSVNIAQATLIFLLLWVITYFLFFSRSIFFLQIISNFHQCCGNINIWRMLLIKIILCQSVSSFFLFLKILQVIES